MERKTEITVSNPLALSSLSTIHDPSRALIGNRALRGEGDERHSLMIGTTAEAHQKIEGWVAEQRARHLQARSDPERGAQSQSQAALLIVAPPSGALVGLELASITRTPFEDARRERGLDTVRRQILDEIADAMTVSKGLAVIDAWTTKNLGMPCETVGDLRQLFPEITVTEVAFLPALRQIPEVFTTYSVGFSERDLINRPTDQVVHSPNERRRIPTQLEFRTDGIAFGTDRSELGGNLGGESTSVVNPEDREIVPYTPAIAESIQTLIPLFIETPRLFELIRQATTDALVVGVGRIQQAALDHARQVGSITTPTIKRYSLAEELKALTPAERQAYQAAELDIGSRVVGTKLKHDDGTVISPSELVHMIGLLDSIPASLLGPTPFRGTMLYDGLRLLLADKAGVIQEACPLDGSIRSHLRTVLFQEEATSDAVNRTMLRIGDELVSRIHTREFETALASANRSRIPLTMSRIEELGAEAAIDLGVSVMALTTYRIQAVSNRPTVSETGSHVSDANRAVWTMKIGASEMELLCAVLRRAGSPALQRIKAISKGQVDFMSHAFPQAGATCEVVYNSESQSLTIIEPIEFPFGEHREKVAAERALAVAHAIGLSLWESHGNAMFWGTMFRAASGSKSAIRESMTAATNEAELVATAAGFLGARGEPAPENFVHGLGMIDAKHDFATTFAAYLLCLPDLEQRAAENTAIAAKLEEIRTVARALGIEDATVREPLCSLTAAKLGIRAIYPEVPDLNSVEALRDYLHTLTMRAERRKEEISAKGDDEDHDEEELSSEAERELLKNREEVLSAIREVFGEAQEVLDDEDLERLVVEIFEALTDERDSPHDALRSLLLSYGELSDVFDDPEEDIIGALEDLGLLSYEERSDQPLDEEWVDE